MGSFQFGLENQIILKKKTIFFIIILMTENMMKEAPLIFMRVKFLV